MSLFSRWIAGGANLGAVTTTTRFTGYLPFERAMQVAELDDIASSRAAQTSVAEIYVGRRSGRREKGEPT